MESGMQGTSDDVSSEETDQVDQVKGEMDATNKRSYDCMFCKQGFTNAQALGGHMNIHRKDRAKAKHKQPTTSSVPSELINEGYVFDPRYVPPLIPTDHQPTKDYHSVNLEAAQRNYRMYLQPPTSSTRLSHGGGDNYFVVPATRSQSSMSKNEEVLGANLSLHIGPSSVDDGEVGRETTKQDEVDLELRLGQDP